MGIFTAILRWKSWGLSEMMNEQRACVYIGESCCAPRTGVLCRFWVNSHTIQRYITVFADVNVQVDQGAGEEIDFKEVSQERAFELLKCDHAGLTSAEAQKRLEEYGPNKLPESSRNPLLVYLGYMWNPLSWAMEAAAIIAIALLDYVDFALIVALLLVNATISYVEESNADKAIKALTSALAPKAKVLRDGEPVTIEAQHLVPGDIVVIRLGDIVPADVKVLNEGDGTPESETPLQCDQAALTGESLPVKKYSGDVCFSGSTIKQGERHCVVYATGMDTFFGRAAALLGASDNVANIQIIMTKIGAMCLLTIGVWVVIEIGVGFGHYNHSCYGGEGYCPILTNILVIIVGGIPIAMPTVLSVTLALGAFKLAKDGAIVSRMSAVEEMAGMDILCSDKTGTLTLNKLTVDVATCAPQGKFTIEDVLKYGALSANTVTEEPIDMVLFESYAERDMIKERYTLKKFIPFNPVDKYTVAHLVENETGKYIQVMKGAPQVVVRNSKNASEIEEECTKKINEYAGRGYRALGVALYEGEGTPTWDLVGLVPLFDPPRHDTRETIERCLVMGIHVKMVTGDQLLIGKETAKQLGLGTNMFTTEALLKAKQGFGLVEGHASVEDLVEEADGFAEVFPEHKHMIVKMLQERGHMLGMTGDGVNDAPALKKANVGIAVAGATDAARGAADIVLTEPGLFTIVGAVIGARKIFQRMTTYARYTVAMTFRVCFTFGLLTVIYDWFFPTILIVLLAVFNDGAMIALSKDKVTPSHVPNRWNLFSIFVTGIVYGLYLTLSSWVFFYVLTHMTFFEDKLSMFALDERYDSLQTWCENSGIPNFNERSGQSITVDTPIYPAVYPNMNEKLLSGTNDYGTSYGDISALDQCITEQKYVRGSMSRAALYLQVSVSGQALVFVVRTTAFSWFSLAGSWTYIAFFGAQFCATLIAIFGFNGYTNPPNPIDDCQFCTLSSGGNNPFFSAREVPVYGTEPTFTASVIGCTYYVVAAWIWAAIWSFGLDPIKWAMHYILNEEGIRQQSLYTTFFNIQGEHIGANANIGVNRSSMSRVSVARLSGRVSAGGYAAGGVPGVGGSINAPGSLLSRASVVRVSQK